MELTSKNKLKIKDRILIFAKEQERFKQDFFKKTGLKYSNYTGINRKTDVSAKALCTIIKHYPNADLYWLITGENRVKNAS